ncbi:ricin-type beta-trefoil lectin domain protein [Nannocystis pusilla]|uniref:ricin-type beta-trefoil lectin domain protein n=1 Tax=Nannocystis pusilla TaxID=889268 RepID=UPI003BF21D66
MRYETTPTAPPTAQPGDSIQLSPAEQSQLWHLPLLGEGPISHVELGLCLTQKGTGNPVTLEECADSADQTWLWREPGALIVNQATGECLAQGFVLDVPVLHTEFCSGEADQYWTMLDPDYEPPR